MEATIQSKAKTKEYSSSVTDKRPHYLRHSLYTQPPPPSPLDSYQFVVAAVVVSSLLIVEEEEEDEEEEEEAEEQQAVKLAREIILRGQQ